MPEDNLGTPCCGVVPFIRIRVTFLRDNLDSWIWVLAVLNNFRFLGIILVKRHNIPFHFSQILGYTLWAGFFRSYGYIFQNFFRIYGWYLYAGHGTTPLNGNQNNSPPSPPPVFMALFKWIVLRKQEVPFIISAK